MGLLISPNIRDNAHSYRGQLICIRLMARRCFNVVGCWWFAYIQVQSVGTSADLLGLAFLSKEMHSRGGVEVEEVSFDCFVIQGQFGVKLPLKGGLLTFHTAAENFIDYWRPPLNCGGVLGISRN